MSTRAKSDRCSTEVKAAGQELEEKKAEVTDAENPSKRPSDAHQNAKTPRCSSSVTSAAENETKTRCA